MSAKKPSCIEWMPAAFLSIFWSIFCSRTVRRAAAVFWDEKEGWCLPIFISTASAPLPKHLKKLSTLNFSGSQTGSTYVHFLRYAVYFNFYWFYVRFPHFVGSSMWMTYVVSEMSTFFTNCTLCHDRTSLTYVLKPDMVIQAHNIDYSNRFGLFLQVKNEKYDCFSFSTFIFSKKRL